MKLQSKLFLSGILVYFTTFLQAQKHFSLDSIQNFYDDKIQIWSGIGHSLPSYYTPGTFGFEIGHSYHSFGFANSSNAKRAFLGDALPVYKFQSVFYGWRISKKHISTSFNVGLGQASFNQWSSRKVNGLHDMLELNTTKCPNILLMLKSNLTTRANGLGIILSANINRVECVLEAMLVLQFGYESTYHPKVKNEKSKKLN